MHINELNTALELWEKAIDAKIAIGIHMEESPKRIKVRHKKLMEISRITGITPEVEICWDEYHKYDQLKVDYKGFRIVAEEEVEKSQVQMAEIACNTENHKQRDFII